jgi:hypothetical protein
MTDDAGAPTRLITDRLKAAGWTRGASAEQLDWPTFEHENEQAELIAEYIPDEDWIRVGLLTDDQEGNLKIDFGDRLESVLDLLVERQDTLGADSWFRFIEDLLALRLRVYAITGEDGDELVELDASSFREQ